MTGTLFVQVISLEGSRDRLDRARAQLDAAGLIFTHLHAVDGRGKPWWRFLPGYIPLINYIWFGRHLTGGELGCYSSHLKAARQFLQSGAKYGLVFEDDLHLRPEFRPALDALLADLDAGTFPGWRLFNLGAVPSKARYYDLMRPLDCGEPLHVCACFDFPLSTHALLWSRSGARRFLRFGWLVLGTVDNWLRSDMAIFGHGYCLNRPIVDQVSSGSLIQNEENAARIRKDGAAKAGWWRWRSHMRSKWRRSWGIYRKRRG